MKPDADDLPPFGGAEASCDFDDAGVAILPVPYEATVSYGGGDRRELAAVPRGRVLP